MEKIRTYALLVFAIAVVLFFLSLVSTISIEIRNVFFNFENEIIELIKKLGDLLT